MLVTVHGIVIAGPIFSTSTSLSKFAVAARALAILRDPQSEKFVERLCTCRFAMQVDSQLESDTTPSDIEDDDEVSAFLWPTDTMESGSD
jgi:endoribonuclease Dicer